MCVGTQLQLAASQAALPQYSQTPTLTSYHICSHTHMCTNVHTPQHIDTSHARTHTPNTHTLDALAHTPTPPHTHLQLVLQVWQLLLQLHCWHQALKAAGVIRHAQGGTVRLNTQVLHPGFEGFCASTHAHSDLRRTASVCFEKFCASTNAHSDLRRSAANVCFYLEIQTYESKTHFCSTLVFKLCTIYTDHDLRSGARDIF